MDTTIFLLILLSYIKHINPFTVQFFLKFKPYYVMRMMTSIFVNTVKGVNI